MLFSLFNALGSICIPTPLTVALTEFFHADTVANVHPLPVSWYLISSVCVYLCSYMHIMFILCSTADAVSSGSWPILFKVLTLNVVICIVCLHFSSFRCLSFVADFSNTAARAPTSAGRTSFLPARRPMRFMYLVWVWVIYIYIQREWWYRTYTGCIIQKLKPHITTKSFTLSWKLGNATFWKIMSYERVVHGKYRI